MTLRHLRVFLAVYQTQNVTRAAERLHMTQPTVTRAVQELERYYGVRLFERINRRLYITQSGRQLYARAVHIVGSFDRMEKELKNWDEFGLLRIGATPTLASVLLPKTLMTFEKKHPKLHVRCSVENGTHLQEALADDRLDFALIEGEVAAEHLHAEPFSEDRLILLLPPDDPRRNAPALTLRELAESPLLLREKGSMGRSFLDRVFAAHDLPLEPLMESISTHAIIQAVHAGLGISFLPQRLIRHSVESGFVATRAVDDEPFVRRNFAVWYEDKFLTRSARELLEDFHRCSADLCGDHARKEQTGRH